MRSWLWISFALAGVVGAAGLLKAQILSNPCCDTCLQPVVSCNCLRTRPVVQTQLREEKVTTYRDVTETRYRQECVVEHTPVTTMEDRVETVWVPQQVTRKVARTVIVPKATARNVPYQVVHRVPETTTRLVPYQTVHHITESVPMTFIAPSSPVISHAWAAPSTIASVPVSPMYAAPVPSTTATMPHRAPPLTPSAKSSGGWQTIPPRSASADRFGGYESDYERPVPTPTDEPAIRKSTWKGNVPAAASAQKYAERAFR